MSRVPGPGRTLPGTRVRSLSQAVQGSLTVGGADPFIAAVTCGTGAFRSAHGEMVITPVDSDTEQYRLTVSR